MRKFILPLLAAALTFAACNNAQTSRPETPPSSDTPAQPVLTGNDSTPVVEPTQPAESQPTTPQATTPATVNQAPASVPKASPAKSESAKNNPATTPAGNSPQVTPPVQVVEKQPVAEKKPELAPVTAPDKSPIPNPQSPIPPSHEAWDKLLRQYVNAAGKVNYAGIKKDKAQLDAYLKTLQDNPPQNDWSRGEKMAFWINAYNAFTVQLIVDNSPLTSITKLDGGKPWDVKRISIGGKNYSLNNIENDILRPTFKDARIHFALNCAAKSCPPLLNRAWTSGNLESNFAQQAKAFINNPAFNKISAKEAQVSKIFEWYAADFGNLTEFLNRYSNVKINAGGKVGYMEYDWTLNGQ